MAEWARLLSECWVKPVAGSNPALPATTNTLIIERVMFLSLKRQEKKHNAGPLAKVPNS